MIGSTREPASEVPLNFSSTSVELPIYEVQMRANC